MDLSSDSPSNIFQSIVTFVSGGVSGSKKTVQDGAGNNTALKLSSTEMESTGPFKGTEAEFTGTLTAGVYEGDGSALTGVKSTTEVTRSLEESSTMLASDSVILTVNAINYNLLPAASFTNKKVFIKNKSATDSLTIIADGTDQIEGSTSNVVLDNNAGQSRPAILLFSDGTAWWILASYYEEP